MIYEEEKIQKACVHAFRYMYPEYARLLSHAANEGHGNPREGARLKSMGVQAGFPDLWLSVAREPYHGLYIEMKTKKGRQSEFQLEYQTLVEVQGYKYVVCRSLEEFIKTVEEYLGPHRDENREVFLKLVGK